MWGLGCMLYSAPGMWGFGVGGLVLSVWGSRLRVLECRVQGWACQGFRG